MIHHLSFLISSQALISQFLSLKIYMMEIESPRRRRSASSEFEFWLVGNSHPALEPSGLLTADELFVDGVLLPLHLLSIPPPPDPNPEPKPPAHSSGFGSGATKEEQESLQPPPPSASASASVSQEAPICSTNPTASSKRWTDMFKVGDKKKESSAEDKEKKKERKSTNGTAELNINIWPFSRSRSAGTTAPKAEAAAATAKRKSSSAPCSRSNSRGDNSGVRRWAASPGRPGVHVGRASPVWQGRRAGKGAEAGAGRAAKGGRPNSKGGMGLNVNSCIGYRNQVSWRGEDCDGGLAAVNTAGNNNNNANGSLFKFRALFSKKVY